MRNTIAVTPGHTLVHWNHSGSPVIFPLQNQQSSDSRGGIPICAPMFSVQQRPIIGCDLPLHGILMYSDLAEVSHNEDTDTITLESDFSATDTFAWNHTVTTRITETSDTLFYTVTIMRAPDCPNKDEMPLSLALHPYFATHDQDFSFQIGDQLWTKDTLPETIIDSAFTPMTTAATKSAMLRTATHTLTMTTTGFDEWCLWTDDTTKYICIEPIYQYREFGLPGTGLQPGTEKTVTALLQVMSSKLDSMEHTF